MATFFFRAVDELGTRHFPMPIAQCPADSEDGGWFLPPSQHLVEASIIVTLALLTFIISGRAFCRQLRAQERDAAEAGIPVRQPDPPTPLVRFFDIILSTVLLVSACTVVVHKWNGINKLPYLLQPCHLLHAFLLYILTLPRGSTQGAVLLSIYLHELSAPFLGTVAADLSCYKQRFEALNWGVQHGLLLVIPLYLLGTRRFGNRVHGGVSLFFFSFAAMALLHYLILVPVSILTHTNLNYVLCPPMPTNELIVRLGVHYRTPMIVVCGTLAWALRYLVVDAFLYFVVDHDRTSARKRKVQPEDSDKDDATTSADNKKKQQGKEGLRKRN